MDSYFITSLHLSYCQMAIELIVEMNPAELIRLNSINIKIHMTSKFAHFDANVDGRWKSFILSTKFEL